MRRTRSHHRSSVGSRRKKTWEGGWYAQNAAAPGLNASNTHAIQRAWARIPANVVDPLTSFPVRDDCTLLRTLFSANAQVEEQTNGPAYVAQFWVGLIAWDSLEGTTLPAITDIPFPSSDQNADWIARCGVNFARVEPISSATVGLTPTSIDGLSDFRSKRKLSSATGILLVTDLHLMVNASGAPWSEFGLSVNWRFLLLEP